MITDEKLKKIDALLGFINITDDFVCKYKLAEVRNELVCVHSSLGVYSCSFCPTFSSNVSECDYCLVEELYNLWKVGIHTISSCCGHGRVPPYIQVLKGDSVRKMKELGYDEIIDDDIVIRGNENKSFRPKTFLPCFRSCCDCEYCVDDDKHFGKICIATEYDINLKWCFKPRIRLEENDE